MLVPGLETVKKLAEKHDRVTVYRDIVGDTVTPITLLNRFRDCKNYFLLESAHLDRSFSRFSFFGVNNGRTMTLMPDRLVISGDGNREEETEDPFGRMVKEFNRSSGHRHPEFGDFSGGFVGWFAYEAVNLMGTLRRPVRMPEGEPLAVFFEVDRFYLFDNHRFKLYAACSIQTNGDVEKAYALAEKQTRAMECELNESVREVGEPETVPEFVREMEKPVFMEKVTNIRDQIAAGECIQTVLSNRYRITGRIDPVTFYRALRRINPSPYLFIMKHGDTVLAGSSPETHLRITGREAVLKPIAGTIRLDGECEVERLKKRLLSDPKERAEHLMLLDLARNDLSTGCEPGTVRVTSSFQPEVYSHVIHIVSEVTGTLMDDVSPLDLFARTFPAGTLTGAPKVRAMELIDEMEPSTRGFYGGCVGYFGYSGDMDTCITIRSVRFGPQETELRAGAGIVYDSNPETEFEEVEGKLGALFSAFRMMGQMEVNHDTTGR